MRSARNSASAASGSDPKLALAALAFLALAAVGSACVSARMSDSASDRLFREGNYSGAAEQLRKGLEKQGDNGRDQLLYLLDLGLTLHTAGQYEESNKVFLQADKIAEIKDYTSLSTEAATLLTSDNLEDYKGEDFEKVLINTYLAMNYALMGDYENSEVEARRVNQKLYMMVSEGERKYKQNAFARYLSASVYEADGDWNDAYVDYKLAHELVPDFPGIGRDLWRCAALLHMPDEQDRWDEELKLTDADHQAARQLFPKSGLGEIVIFYENGISPIKKPNPQYRSVPAFFPRPNPVQYANVEVDGAVQGRTAILEDIEKTAIENLQEKWGGIIAKKIAGVVAKEIVANQIARKNATAGALAKLFMYASDQADIRSWNLLPRDLQVARFAVPPGLHRVRLLPVGDAALGEKNVQVEAGKKAFVDFRYIPK